LKKIILSAQKLCKSFAHNGVQNHVLNHVDLEIYEGDFTVIMGASGSGKSTLLYALSGMDRATAGEVIYQGSNIVSYPEKKLAALRHTDFGFIFQQMHLVSNLSLYENVAVPGYLNREKQAGAVNERARILLEKMGLTEMMKRLPSQVSGGEQQRAAIARAVINFPAMLFADEPTGALNRSNSNTVLNLLSTLNEDGQSILMVTHDVHCALRATRILYLEDGSVSGELTLPPYQSNEETSRKTQMNSWLAAMKW